jgi:hypothetical protein
MNAAMCAPARAAMLRARAPTLRRAPRKSSPWQSPPAAAPQHRSRASPRTNAAAAGAAAAAAAASLDMQFTNEIPPALPLVTILEPETKRTLLCMLR